MLAERGKGQGQGVDRRKGERIVWLIGLQLAGQLKGSKVRLLSTRLRTLLG